MMTDIEKRGTKNAKGKKGTGNAIIRKAVKAVVGNVVGGVGGAAGGFLDEAGAAVGNVASDLSAESGVMDAVSGGRTGIQGYITDKTGIPTNAEGVVGQVGERLGIQPAYIESVQDVLANRGPKQAPLQASQNFPQQQKQSPYQNVYQNSRVGTGARGQSGVMGLVNQRFGKDSQIAGYLGAYQEGGSVTIPGTPGTGDKPYLIDVAPGERVSVQSADMRNENRAIIYDDRGNRSYASEEHGSQIKGTDLMRPHQQRATGLDKAFGWFGAIGSKGTGASPGQRIQGSEDWRQARAIMDEVTRFRRQLGDEQRAPTYDEQIGVDRLLNSIGQPSLYGIMPGSERAMETGEVNERGQNITVMQRLSATDAGGLGWVTFGDPIPKGQARSGDKRNFPIDSDGDGLADRVQTQQLNLATGEYVNIGDPSGITRGLGAAQLDAQKAQAEQVMLMTEELNDLLDYGMQDPNNSETFVAFTDLEGRAKKAFNELVLQVRKATTVGMNADQKAKFLAIRKKLAKFNLEETQGQTGKTFNERLETDEPFVPLTADERSNRRGSVPDYRKTGLGAAQRRGRRGKPRPEYGVPRQ